MDNLSNSIIFIICRYLINYDDLISLYLVSKRMKECCNHIFNEFRNDNKLIREMMINSEIRLLYGYNFFDRHILNGWYKYGYYIFESKTKINKKFIPKEYVVRNHESTINKGLYNIIVKKKKKRVIKKLKSF
jgi:hypothetical protein